MNDKKVKAGVIGVGNNGIMHLEAYLQNKDAELVAVCDSNSERLEFIVNKYGIRKAYTDYREMLGYGFGCGERLHAECISRSGFHRRS